VENCPSSQCADTRNGMLSRHCQKQRTALNVYIILKKSHKGVKSTFDPY